MKILIIEDDIVIRTELAKLIESNGYTAPVIERFTDIPKQIEEGKPDLILMDVNLPETDGYTLCNRIRVNNNVPIIIITSRDTEMDELIGMNMGADDFVKKPFSTNILLARIERLLKRTYQMQKNDTLEHNGILLDLLKGTVSKDSKSETLSKNEIGILSYLIKNKQHPITRDDLIMHLWENSEFVDDNTLSVNVTRLRKKLEAIGAGNMIETRRGLGYVLI